MQWQNSLSTSFIFLRTAVNHGHRDRRRQYVEVGEPSMMAQLSDDAGYWQELAEETRREVDRKTNLRNLLNLKDLAERAEECDRKALLAKRAELRNTFMDLAEQYRVLALKVKASQKEHSSSAKLLVEKIAAQRLAERLSSFSL